MVQQKRSYQFNVLVAGRVVPEENSHDLAAVLVAAELVSADCDSLGKLILHLGLLAPVKLVALLFSNEEEVRVTVSQLVVLALGRVDAGVGHLSLRANSHEVHI
jgi:hypothetical protein